MCVLIAVQGQYEGAACRLACSGRTIHTVGTQNVHALHSPASRAPVERGDVLEGLAGHEALALLAVGRFLLGHGVEDTVPYVGEGRERGERGDRKGAERRG